VCAPVVVGENLDVLVPVAPVYLVLETKIGKMDRLVEIGQVVFERPSLDLACIPIRSPLAVGAPAVVSLQPLLVLPLKVVLQDDAADLRALLAESLLGAQVGAIERGVMRQFPRPADPSAELLTTLVVTVSAMAVEQTASALRQGHDSFASVERHASHQPLISQVSMVVVARIERALTGIAEVAFSDNPKCPDRRERAAVLAVEFVGAIPVVQHNLSLEAARQVQALHERVPWVPIPVTVPLAPVFVAVARVVAPSRVVDIAAVTRVAVTVTWIEAVEHTLLLSDPIDTFNKNRCVALVRRVCA
jgi:hypothetical protein